MVEKRQEQAVAGFTPKTERYRWNALNQLTGYEDPNGNRWEYQYDPFNRRIKKQRTTYNSKAHYLISEQNTLYRWSGDQLIQEVPLYADGTPAYDQTVHWHYEPDSFAPLAKRQHGKLFYIVNDVAGTPQALYTEQGQAVQHQQLKLWGEWDPEYNHQQAAANDERYVSLRFQGQQYDPESGLHYNRHRYYDPQLKQYISPDPIGLAGGLRPQGYVGNPLTWVDPLGLAPESIRAQGFKFFRARGYSVADSWRYAKTQINMRHVFHGEINSHGNAVGFHYEGTNDTPYISHARIKQMLSPPNAQGVYRAKIELKNSSGSWIEKQHPSSFFPKHWSKPQVASEIRSAYYNAVINCCVQANGKWEGTSNSGIRIGGYLHNVTGNINTAFPIYQ